MSWHHSPFWWRTHMSISQWPCSLSWLERRSSNLSQLTLNGRAFWSCFLPAKALQCPYWDCLSLIFGRCSPTLCTAFSALDAREKKAKKSRWRTMSCSCKKYKSSVSRLLLWSTTSSSLSMKTIASHVSVRSLLNRGKAWSKKTKKAWSCLRCTCSWRQVWMSNWSTSFSRASVSLLASSLMGSWRRAMIWVLGWRVNLMEPQGCSLTNSRLLIRASGPHRPAWRTWLRTTGSVGRLRICSSR